MKITPMGDGDARRRRDGPTADRHERRLRRHDGRCRAANPQATHLRDARPAVTPDATALTAPDAGADQAAEVPARST